MKPEIKLVETCWACPEQYDAFCNGEQVGYIRFRHNEFTVECPDVEGELVYSTEANGDWRLEDNERNFYLDNAKEAIIEWISFNRPELLA